MKMPKALMEAINETTDALEQAACGLFDPKSMSLVAEWHDTNEGNFRVTLTNTTGGYSADWDIDVEPIPNETKVQVAAKKAVTTGRKRLAERARATATDDPAPGPG